MTQNYLQSGYLAERVLSASPAELIRMLYEGALSSIDVAIEMLHTNDIMARGRAITKAINILGELRVCLTSGEQAEFMPTLAGLYGYMEHRLLEAHAQKSEEALKEVSRLLKSLYEGWLGLMKKLSGAADAVEAERSSPVTLPSSPYEMCSNSPAAGRFWQI